MSVSREIRLFLCEQLISHAHIYINGNALLICAAALLWMQSMIYWLQYPVALVYSVSLNTTGCKQVFIDALYLSVAGLNIDQLCCL